MTHRTVGSAVTAQAGRPAGKQTSSPSPKLVVASNQGATQVAKDPEPRQPSAKSSGHTSTSTTRTMSAAQPHCSTETPASSHTKAQAQDQGAKQASRHHASPPGAPAGSQTRSQANAQTNKSSGTQTGTHTAPGGSAGAQAGMEAENGSGGAGGGAGPLCTPEERAKLTQLLVHDKSITNSASRKVCSSDFYSFGKVVGVGSFAKVRVARHKLTGQQVAIKTYEKSKVKDTNQWKRIQQEIKLMEKLDHPLVIRLFETIESPRRVHIVMEYLPGANLCAHVKAKRRLPEHEAKRIFADVACSLEYLHAQHVVHRDIKLENIIFDKQGNAKLIDFGFSVNCKDKRLKVFCGTPSYMAPEIVKRAEYKGKPTDIWSLGVILFAMISGCFPFSAKAYPDLYKKIVRGHYRFPDNLFSPGAQELVSSMLVMDPGKRPSISQVRAHPWLKDSQSLAHNPKLLHASVAAQFAVSRDAQADVYPQAVSRMEVLGIAKQELLGDILAKKRNGLTTCYYLLVFAMGLRSTASTATG